MKNLREFIDRYWPDSPECEKVGRQIATLLRGLSDADAARALEYARRSYVRAESFHNEGRKLEIVPCPDCSLSMTPIKGHYECRGFEEWDSRLRALVKTEGCGYIAPRPEGERG